VAVSLRGALKTRNTRDLDASGGRRCCSLVAGCALLAHRSSSFSSLSLHLPYYTAFIMPLVPFPCCIAGVLDDTVFATFSRFSLLARYLPSPSFSVHAGRRAGKRWGISAHILLNMVCGA